MQLKILDFNKYIYIKEYCVKVNIAFSNVIFRNKGINVV